MLERCQNISTIIKRRARPVIACHVVGRLAERFCNEKKTQKNTIIKRKKTLSKLNDQEQYRSSNFLSFYRAFLESFAEQCREETAATAAEASCHRATLRAQTATSWQAETCRRWAQPTTRSICSESNYAEFPTAEIEMRRSQTPAQKANAKIRTNQATPQNDTKTTENNRKINTTCFKTSFATVTNHSSFHLDVSAISQKYRQHSPKCSNSYICETSHAIVSEYFSKPTPGRSYHNSSLSEKVEKPKKIRKRSYFPKGDSKHAHSVKNFMCGGLFSHPWKPGWIRISLKISVGQNKISHL